jgi:hypothetical protein
MLVESFEWIGRGENLPEEVSLDLPLKFCLEGQWFCCCTKSAKLDVSVVAVCC